MSSVVTDWQNSGVNNMSKHIGIAACSAEGAALCYRTICVEGSALLGHYSHPEISMHTPSLSEYIACLSRNDIEGVGVLMLSSASKLAAAGAEFLICPDNTIHQAMAFVQPRSPLPWLHIAEVVAQEAKACSYRKVGILGTHWLVTSNVYPEKLDAHGLQWQRPSPYQQNRVGNIIMNELVHGECKPESTEYLVTVIRTLKEQGCDTVVLGCTELPLVLNDRNSPLPTLDSTRLLARAALRHALS